MSLSGFWEAESDDSAEQVYTPSVDGSCITMCVWGLDEGGGGLPYVHVENLHQSGDYVQLKDNKPIYFTVDSGLGRISVKPDPLGDSVFYWGVVRR